MKSLALCVCLSLSLAPSLVLFPCLMRCTLCDGQAVSVLQGLKLPRIRGEKSLYQLWMRPHAASAKSKSAWSTYTCGCLPWDYKAYFPSTGVKNQINFLAPWRYKRYKITTRIVFDSCDPMGWSPPGSSIHGILQARVLEWAAISFSRGSPRPRDWTWVSCVAGRHFNLWANREAHSFPGKTIALTKQDLCWQSNVSAF